MPADLGDDREPRAYDELRRTALAALLRPEGVFADRWQERRAHKAALDRWTGRLRYDVWRLLAPTPVEWAWWPLPDALTALYPPVRIARLAAAAVRGPTGSADPATATAAAPRPPDGAGRTSTHGVPGSRRTSG